jgi:hypothetical protein
VEISEILPKKFNPVFELFFSKFIFEAYPTYDLPVGV